jgi:hypothetical protein
MGERLIVRTYLKCKGNDNGLWRLRRQLQAFGWDAAMTTTAEILDSVQNDEWGLVREHEGSEQGKADSFGMTRQANFR